MKKSGSAAIILLFLALSLKAEVVKGPYLIFNGNPEEMTVLWQLDSVQTCTIRWGLTTTYELGAADVNSYGDFQYEYTISGLTPGTLFYYLVEGVGSGSFRTAPPPTATNAKLFVYGDTRSYPATHDSVCYQMIQTFSADPSFQAITLLAGDWVTRGDEELYWTNDFFPRTYPNLLHFQANMPIGGPRGNHEDSGILFKKYWPFPYADDFYWSLDYGPVLIVVLDQYVSYGPGSPQYDWLVNTLATSNKPWKMIILHEPGWSAGPHGNDSQVQNIIQPLCLQYGVDFVFAGHNHNYARAVVDDIQHVTSGGGGAELRTPTGGSYVIISEESHHHCEIDIQGNHAAVTARRNDGTIIENFVIAHEALVRIVSPEDGAVLPAGQSIPIEAEVIIADGVCTKVSFFSDNVYIGEDSSSPYLIDWVTPSTAGTMQLTAIAEIISGGIIENIESEPVDVTISVSPPPAEIRAWVSASSDDAEERISSGWMYLNSSDLELISDGGSDQIVGTRFVNLPIPQGAIIVDAHLQFTVDEVSSAVCNLDIKGQASDNAETFVGTYFDVSRRPTTTASAPWSPPDWLVVGASANDQRTPDLSTIIQEIVDRPGWVSGNSLAIIITGTGRRTAEAYDGSRSQAPELIISYALMPPNEPPVATITAPADGASFLAGQGISFSGSALDDQDGDLSSWLVWESSLDGPIGDGALFSRSDLSLGAHTITAMVTDSGGLTDVDQISISVTTVGGNLPPIVSAGSDQTIGLFDNAILDGSVSDDGLPVPPGKVTIAWSQVSGPGTVSFADASAADTTASFSEGGSYVLELAADDGEASASDQVIITVNSGSIIRVPLDYTSIQAAIDAAQSGDLVLVSPGLYTESITISGKTITLASEFHISQDPSLIDQTIIDGGNSTAVSVAVSVGPETKIVGFTIQNGSDGIKAWAKLYILDNRFLGNIDAIDYEGGGGICRSNVFEYNSDDAIDLDGPAEVIIEDNVIRNNGDDGIEIRLMEYIGPTLNIIIRNNVISRNDEDGIQLIGYPELSDRFFLIERNLFESNSMVGLGLMDNAETLEDFRAASIPDRIHLFNNTFVDNPYGVTGGDNLIALNNLFVNSINIALKGVDGNSISAYNLFWNNGIDNQGSNMDGSTTLFVDPLLDSAYHLQQDSPAIDAGTAYFEWLGETVLDLSDNEFSGLAPDLGAHESDFGTPSNQSPTVTITAPSDGASFDEDQNITFTGTAIDTEDGDITSSLVWTSSLDGEIGAGGLFSTSTLQIGTHTITAETTDSGGLSGQDQITVTVTVNSGNQAPVADAGPDQVVTDGDGDGSESVTLDGSGSSDPDGSIVSYVWSEGGETIATGEGATVTLLVGVHTLTLAVTDDGGATDTDTIIITVNAPPNEAPVVTITAPPDGTSFMAGETVTFTGTASDAEDGDITSGLVWTSSLDGEIGTGGSFSISTLQVGPHTITAAVTDNGGLTDQSTITVTINSGNQTPVVRIISPSSDSTFPSGTSISFKGMASDVEDGNLKNRLEWTSDLDGAIGTGFSFTRSISPGIHTITAAVSDSGGATGQAKVTVTVGTGNQQPTVTIISPADGSSFSRGESITFVGSASDPEDGNVTAGLAWASSLDGPIGTGGLFSTSILRVGPHTITAAVTDAGGLTAQSQISISVTEEATPPAPPDNLTAAGTKFVTLSWNDNSNNEQQFRIYRCEGGGCVDFDLVATTGPNTVIYQDYSVERRTTYRYKITAVNQAGESAFSSIAEVKTK